MLYDDSRITPERSNLSTCSLSAGEGEEDEIMQRDLEAILDGTVAGVGATIAMSGGMAIAQQLGLLGEQPPKLISRQLLDAVGIHDRDDEMENALAVLAHVGFGSVIGSLFAVLHRRLNLPGTPAAQGIIFASLVWIASYQGLLPALGTMPAPEDDRPGRPATMLASHWVYGAMLGAIMSRRPAARREGVWKTLGVLSERA